LPIKKTAFVHIQTRLTNLQIHVQHHNHNNDIELITDTSYLHLFVVRRVYIIRKDWNISV